MKIHKLATVVTLFLFLGILGELSKFAMAQESAGSKLELYGFAMADYIQDYRRVNPAWDDTLRPSRIPTTPGQFGSDGQAMLSARQSKFGAKGNFMAGDHVLDTKFEFDLFGVGVDEGQTTIRLRHAYGQWGPWLGGQTHSLFMDVDVFPNVIDYWGPAGMSFFRLPQLRWTPMSGTTSFSVAIEKPSEDIDTGKIRELDPTLFPSDNLQADEKVPDLTAQVRHTGDWGHVQLAGILRRIGFETKGNPDSSPRGFETGWGLDLTSAIKLRDNDKLLLSVIHGHGIATFMNDGGTDLAPEGTPGNLSAKAVPLSAMMAYYDLSWSDRWSTSLGYSRTQVQNTSFQSSDAFQTGEYASINLLHYPAKDVMMGIELLWGRRTDNNGATGDDVRSQISFRYNFSSKS